MIVVDASLAVKWFIDEADTVRALAFFRRSAGTMTGPDLLLTEVANAIVRRANADKRLLPWAEANLAKWRGFISEEVVTTNPLDAREMEASARLALRLGHPVADCVYLRLAMGLECDLATCDAAFAAKARGAYGRVRLIAEYDG